MCKIKSPDAFGPGAETSLMTMATFLKHTQGMLLLLKHILVGLMDPVNPLPSSLCSCPCNVSAPLSLQLFARSLSLSLLSLSLFLSAFPLALWLPPCSLWSWWRWPGPGSAVLGLTRLCKGRAARPAGQGLAHSVGLQRSSRRPRAGRRSV